MRTPEPAWRTKSTRFLLRTCIFILACLLCAPATGTDTTPAEPTPKISSQQIEAKINEIEATEGLEETEKKELIELYRKTLSNLEKQASYKAAEEGFAEARGTAPDKTREIRKKLEELEKRDAEGPNLPEIPGDTPTEELEQMLVKEQADLAALQAKLAEIDNQIKEQSARPATVRERLIETKQLQEDTSAELKSAEPDTSDDKTRAQRLFVESKQRLTGTEINMLDQELLSQPARLELLKAQRALTARNTSSVEARVRFLGDHVNQRRRSDAQQAEQMAAETERKASSKHPLIRELAERNAALGTDLTRTASELETLTQQKEELEKQASRYEADLQSARQKLEIAGLSRALGTILQEQRRQLPDITLFEKQANNREKNIIRSSLQQIQHEEERQDLGDLDLSVSHLLVAETPETQQEISAEIRELLKTRREMLDKSIKAETDYLRGLGELEYSSKRLIDSAREYDLFLAENLLWMPSSPQVGYTTLAALIPAGTWLLSPTAWLDVFHTLGQLALQKPLLLALASLLIATLFLLRPRLKEKLLQTNRYVGYVSRDQIHFTFMALLMIPLLAAPWPLLMWFTGRLIQTSTDAGQFSIETGLGLEYTAPLLFNLLVFSWFCAPGSVADGHFRWPENTLKLLRQEIRRLTLIAVPSVFIAVLSIDGQFSDSLARFAFLVVMIALAVFMSRILNPVTGPLHQFIKRHSGHWLARTRYIWYSLAVGLPLLLAGLSLVGYFYTALILIDSLINTLWLVLGIIALRELIVRWLVLTRRKLALQVAREKQEAERVALEEQEDSQSVADLPPVEIEVPEIDLEAVDTQTRQLLSTGLVVSMAIGLWLIWNDVFPALGIFDQVTLWQHTTTIDGVEQLQPITLENLALALIIGFLTVVFTRNMPGLLEVILLQRLSLTPGSRYAITSLVRYTLVAIGIIAVFGIMGWKWSQIQWLLAALSVGLGFGLQEIVANFICGIIILFERPIRVGDRITIGDTTGIVSKIRIRATTITNWDKQELLVPNKEFIPGRLLNWSLSDQLNRIVIPIGIAYGSDVPGALKLLEEAAVENENVLEDPQPVITFEGFGDNSLNLIMRCYLESLDNRLTTTSNLHQAINRKFEDAGISIAFPQRDIHLDTSRPLDINIHHVSGNPGKAAD